MIFKKFRVGVIIRLILMTLLLGLLMYNAFGINQYVRSFYFLIFLLLSVLELFWYIDRTNRNLANFFESILESDFTTTFTETGKGKSFHRLYRSLNRITKKFHEIGEDRETQYYLLETMLQQVKVGIISFNTEGQVGMMNDAFKSLISINFLSNIDTLKKINPELQKALNEIKPNQNLLLKTEMGGKLLHLSILASFIKVRDETLKLVTIQNIKNEIEAGEVEAWQKLIRVLAHEIMNSVTPITSLSDTLLEILENERSKEKHVEFPENFTTGLKAIKNRSEALNRFTEAYQNLTRIPSPKFDPISAREFSTSIETLLRPEITAKKLKLETLVEPPDHTFKGDVDLLSQAVINLIKNAMQAVQEISVRQGRIWFKIEKIEGNTRILIEDNGPGIQGDRIENIFIPFYTSRKDGTGIGLSLVKQIVQLHNGTIEVESVPDERTSFIIQL